jgi:hypothetical protein
VGNAGILGCRHFSFEFSVLDFKHAVPEMIALWKMHTGLFKGCIKIWSKSKKIENSGCAKYIKNIRIFKKYLKKYT